jgi:FdhE protein
LETHDLSHQVGLRRAEAGRWWEQLVADRPTLARAVQLQRRLLTRQLALLDGLLPVLMRIEPPDEADVLHWLADGFPVLRGRIGALPIEVLAPQMIDLARDIAEVSGYAAAARVADTVERGAVDVAALLAHVYQRDQESVRRLSDVAHVVVDVLWLVADVVVAPIVYAEQLRALREGIADSPVREALERWQQGYCPACGSWPALAEVFAADQLLRCAFCAATWPRPARCVYCGESGSAFRTVVPDEARPGRRLEVCRNCGGFLKSLSVDAITAFPLVAIADLASADLDQIATHHGFRRLPLPQFR